MAESGGLVANNCSPQRANHATSARERITSQPALAGPDTLAIDDFLTLFCLVLHDPLGPTR
jgi:hypothetical protein